MSDRMKKPKNYRRGRDLSCTPSVPARTEMCKASFPCLVNIYVLAGLEQPCAACAPEIQQMRDLHGYRQEGKFWLCDGLTEDQQQMIRHRIGQAHPAPGGERERKRDVMNENNMDETINLLRADVEFLEAADIRPLWNRQAEWSQATFGSDAECGPIGPLKHLEHEAREAQESPDDPSEYADCLLLVLDAARRSGMSWDNLLAAAMEKHERNRQRTWAKPTSDEPVFHVAEAKD